MIELWTFLATLQTPAVTFLFGVLALVIGALVNAQLNRNRRLAKDFEQTIASATAWLFIASVQLLTRRLATSGNHAG